MTIYSPDSWVNTVNFFCGAIEAIFLLFFPLFPLNSLQTIDFYASLMLYQALLAAFAECTPCRHSSTPPPAPTCVGQSSNWAAKLTKAERVVQIIIAIITTITSWELETEHASLACKSFCRRLPELTRSPPPLPYPGHIPRLGINYSALLGVCSSCFLQLPCLPFVSFAGGEGGFSLSINWPEGNPSKYTNTTHMCVCARAHALAGINLWLIKISFCLST